MDKIAQFNREDKINEIQMKVDEIESAINTILSATTNEYNPPELKDVQNSLTVILSYIKTLKYDISDFTEIIDS